MLPFVQYLQSGCCSDFVYSFLVLNDKMTVAVIISLGSHYVMTIKKVFYVTVVLHLTGV